MKENSVENRIVEVASNPIDTKLNLAQFKKAKAKALTHKEVCEKVVNYGKSNPYIPIYAILMCGVGSNAFKNAVFDKGYTKFNEEKVSTTFEMTRAYMEKMNLKGQPNDVVWRIVSKFYDRKSHSLDDFKSALASAKVIPNADSRDCFVKLCDNLGI